LPVLAIDLAAAAAPYPSAAPAAVLATALVMALAVALALAMDLATAPVPDLATVMNVCYHLNKGLKEQYSLLSQFTSQEGIPPPNKE